MAGSTRTSSTAGESATATTSGGETADTTVTKEQPTTESGTDTSSGTRVKYLGPEVHKRTLTAKDFKSVDLEHKEVSWSRQNNHVVTIEDDNVVKFLTESDVFKVDNKPTFKALKPGES